MMDHKIKYNILQIIGYFLFLILFFNLISNREGVEFCKDLVDKLNISKDEFGV